LDIAALDANIGVVRNLGLTNNMCGLFCRRKTDDRIGFGT